MTQVPPWWRVYLEPKPGWDATDYEEVLKEFEKKPPNRQLLSPILAGFIAGVVQANGSLGYLKILQNPETYTPFTEIKCDVETLNFISRQINDGWGFVSERGARLIVIGLRCILLLKIIGPYLRGWKYRAYDAIIGNGYKLHGPMLEKIFQTYELDYGLRTVSIEGKKFRMYVFRGKLPQQGDLKS